MAGKIIWLDWFGLGLIIIDQLTKFLARNFALKITFNSGGAFGLASNSIGFDFLSLMIGLGLTLAFIFKRNQFQKQTRIGLTLFFSGAVGNLIDRLIYRQTVDFIDLNKFLPGQFFPLPIFNLADAFLVLGIFLLSYYYVKN